MIPQPLSRTVARITVKALDRKSARLATLLGSWEAVVGKTRAEISLPVKFVRAGGAAIPGEERPAILHLAVPPAWKTEFQHEAPGLIARINSFFGYQAVGELRFSPRTMPRRLSSGVEKQAAQSNLNCDELEAKVAGIGDPELKAALVRLGQAIRGRALLAQGGDSSGGKETA